MATLDMALVGKRLRALREAQGLSQTALAARAGLNLGNLNEVEQGRKKGIYAETIVALATALTVSTDYLLGLSETSKRPTPRTARPPRQPRTPKRRRPRMPAPVGSEV